MNAVTTHFEKLPDIFLKTYQRDLMAWAVRRDSPRLTLRLLRKPGGDGGVLDICHVQQTVELMVETYRHPVSGEVKVMVGPASNFDVEMIEYHSQALPGIVAARAVYLERWWATSHEKRRYWCENMPAEFVRHYKDQFEEWVQTAKWKPRRRAIPFDLAPGQVRPKDVEGRDIIAGAWLESHWDLEDAANPRFIIQPVDEHAEQLIEEHTAEMRRHWK